MNTLFDLNSEDLQKTDLYEKFLVLFNDIRKAHKKRAKFIRPRVDITKRRFREMVKNGVTLQHMEIVINNAFKDKFHEGTNWKYITPDFVLRGYIYDRYIDYTPEEKVTDSDF